MSKILMCIVILVFMTACSHESNNTTNQEIINADPLNQLSNQLYGHWRGDDFLNGKSIDLIIKKDGHIIQNIDGHSKTLQFKAINNSRIEVKGNDLKTAQNWDFTIRSDGAMEMCWNLNPKRVKILIFDPKKN